MTFTHLVGIDEVGRGPIAGPLCLGGCALLRHRSGEFYRRTRGLKDSKQLSPRERERFAQVLKDCEKRGICTLSLSFVSSQVIDIRGLTQALRSAIRQVLRALVVEPKESFIMLDGSLRAPDTFPFQESVIGGDEQELLIAAASVIAKVERDHYMVRLAARYPEYGFEVHKGYGTKKHYEALRRHGVSPLHRRSFLQNSVFLEELSFPRKPV
jgi:ribonuclease HII